MQAARRPPRGGVDARGHRPALDERAVASLGPAFDFMEGYENFWAYIPHFVHAPFYVYAYAFGDGLVNALYAVYEESPEGFEDKYFDMLARAGRNTTPSFWRPSGWTPPSGTRGCRDLALHRRAGGHGELTRPDPKARRAARRVSRRHAAASSRASGGRGKERPANPLRRPRRAPPAGIFRARRNTAPCLFWPEVSRGELARRAKRGSAPPHRPCGPVTARPPEP